MKKFGIKSPELDDEEKEFFNYVDKNYSLKTKKTKEVLNVICKGW